jgi:hypothetical protein
MHGDTFLTASCQHSVHVSKRWDWNCDNVLPATQALATHMLSVVLQQPVSNLIVKCKPWFAQCGSIQELPSFHEVPREPEAAGEMKSSSADGPIIPCLNVCHA